MKNFTIIALAWLALCAVTAEAKPKKSEEKPAPAPSATPAVPVNSAEQVDVNSIKEKYWARGDESELGVVQNRLYSKSRKVELSLFGGVTTSDPFLSIKNYGGSVGFHFSEYLAAEVMAWKYSASGSNALEVLQDPTGANSNANINKPKSFIGAEAVGSILYGKLSLLGQKIIYFDLHLAGGAGITATQNGSYFTPSVGIGQQVYLTQKLTLKIDYRLQRYNEEIIDRIKTLSPSFNKSIGSRVNFNNSIMIGVSYFFGSNPGDQKPGDVK